MRDGILGVSPPIIFDSNSAHNGRFVRNSDFGGKADVYSFGKFVFEVIPVLMGFVKSLTVRKERRSLTGRRIKIQKHSVVEGCWEEDTKQRSDMEEVMLILVINEFVFLVWKELKAVSKVEKK
jgi:hypothetical protein